MQDDFEKVENNVVYFYSTNHKRFENNVNTSNSRVERSIKIIFSEDKQRALFSISLTLSEKSARLQSVEGNKYSYLGTDPDFSFIIIFDDFENIDHFILKRNDRNLRIEYYD